MSISPFNYGTTVSLQAFTNRKHEIKKLKENFLSGINTIIISPRRWGKSSLVERVCNEMSQEQPALRIAQIDFFTIRTEEELLEQFARAVLKASSSQWEVWWQDAKQFLGRLVPKLELSPDPSANVALTFDWQELAKHPEDILNLPELLAEKKNCHIIICIDEFQHLANLPDYEAVENRLRSCWQRQKRVTYCLYGSKRHMMSEIFNKPSKPFYRFGDIMMLPKISRADWVVFLEQSFMAEGKSINAELAGAIADSMDYHPWYVQQLAHYTFNNSKSVAEPNVVERALEEVINANVPFYEKQAEMLSTTQINLLKAVAKGEVQFTSARVMREYRLGTPRNVQKNRIILEENDIIDKQNGQWKMLDPVFAQWFRQRYMGQARRPIFER